VSKIYFLLFFFLHSSSEKLFSQNPHLSTKDTGKCVINEIKVDINEGTINVGTQNIDVQICKPCNYFFNSTDVLSRFDLKEDPHTPQKEKDTFYKVNDKIKNVVVKQFVDSILSTKGNDCNLSFIQETVKKNTPYKVYQNKNGTATLLLYSNQEFELAKYGLKVNYLQREGLTRVKELGRYYFLKEDGSPLLEVSGEAERYDFATDFNNGIAIVGNLTSEMNYRFMDPQGKKSRFSFIDFQESFAGFKNLFKLKNKAGKSFLANANMNIISGFYDSLYYFKDNDYIRYKAYNDTATLGIKGIVYFKTVNGKYLNGLLKIDTLGNIVDSLASKFATLEFLGHNVVSAGNYKDYVLLDAENNFKKLFLSKDKIYYCRTSNSGIEFATSDPKSDSVYDFWSNTHGEFIDFTRTIIEPQYYSLGYFNKLGYITAVKAPKDKYSKKSTWKETYLDLQGKQVFDDYGYIGNPDENDYIKIRTVKGKWGYVNGDEKIVIKPMYDYLLRFDKGFAWAEVEDKKCGLIDREGKFSDLSELVSCLRYRDDNKWHYYPYKFTDCDIAITEFAIGTKNYKEKKFGIINYYKEVLLKGHPRQLYIVPSGIEGVCLVTDSFRLFNYYQSGRPFLKTTIGRITQPFKDGFAVAECVDGGIALLDSTGKQYKDCLPYDSLNVVLNGQFAIATKNKLKGLIKISTGEKFIEPMLDNIDFTNRSFVCTKGTSSFTIDSNLDNKRIKFDSGDFELFQSIVLKKD